MKKYKTWETIKMLTENPELKFECKAANGVITRLLVNNYGYLEMNNTAVGNSLEGNIGILDDWEVILEPVSFMDAFNALQKFKNIHVLYNGKVTQFNGNSTEEHTFNEVEIAYGKWYIEEP